MGAVFGVFWGVVLSAMRGLFRSVMIAQGIKAGIAEAEEAEDVKGIEMFGVAIRN